MIMQKVALLSLLNGYKKANELIVEEKKKRLAQLTTEESLCEYIALCELAEEGIKSSDIERLQKRRVEFLLKKRQIFNKAKR